MIHTRSIRMAINLNGLTSTQLEELVRRARERQEEVGRERIEKVREKLEAAAKAEGFTIAELFGASAGKGKPRGKVPPKYRNPADGSVTWSGRGMRPRWFLAALKGG